MSGRCWPRTAIPATARRSKRVVFGSTRSRRFSREENRGRRWCRASRMKACSSVRSITRARRCPPTENSPPEKVAVAHALGRFGCTMARCAIVQPMPRSIRPVLVRGAPRPADRALWSLPAGSRRTASASSPASEDVAWSIWPRNPIDCFILKSLAGPRPDARSRSEQGVADPPHHVRFDRTATDSRGSRRLSRG